MSEPTAKVETWGIVELFGHKKISGYLTTETFGSNVMLRCDFPETTRNPAFVQYYGMSAIYSLSPTDEKTANLMAESLQVSPPIAWELEQAISKSYQTGKKEALALVEKTVTPSEDSHYENNY